ncbi:MAG: hypothetical protein H6627_04645 [Calditrichae bacterium]|nr:hypothetical protein [Calditrichota bacterium]MCB9057830.1 hypothetical protein [Calditrichia bacterium]
MFFLKRFRALSVLFFVLLLYSCATWYQKNLLFQESFSTGDIEKANELLDENKEAAEGKDRLLYFLQKGVVLQMLGKYEESNQYFEDAYIFTEDLQKNYALEALSFFSNPTIVPYEGEDFEVVQLHYYKAMNYLRMNMLEEAQVECRRLNIKLNDLNDRYGNKKNRYKQDAFALNLMGIIFEASGEINNAFTSYRNAYETYEKIYKPYFGVDAPEQLKKDLLRTAYLNGFDDDLRFYQKIFKMEYKPVKESGGELVFFLNNGLGPVKDEWSLNFAIVKGSGGSVNFVNEELGLSFPFSSGKKDDLQLGDLKVVRVAFPKYIERKPFYVSAQLSSDSTAVAMEKAQDINQIAFKTLQDRMLRELGNSLLRLAVKQASEYAVRQKSEGLGALLSVVNAVTEKADTRNWQTLPYSIFYARIALPEGMQSVKLTSRSANGSSMTKDFTFDIKKGHTTFQFFHLLESSTIPQK